MSWALSRNYFSKRIFHPWCGDNKTFLGQEVCNSGSRLVTKIKGYQSSQVEKTVSPPNTKVEFDWQAKTHLINWWLMWCKDWRLSVKQQKPGGGYGTHTRLGEQYGQKIQTSPKWLEWGDAQMSGSGTHCNNNCAAISATLRIYTKDRLWVEVQFWPSDNINGIWNVGDTCVDLKDALSAVSKWQKHILN